MFRLSGKKPFAATRVYSLLNLPATKAPRCLVGSQMVTRKEYSQGSSSNQPPMSKSFEGTSQAPRPPKRGSGGKIAAAIGVAAIAGGALLFLDPFGMITEKKSLASPPKRLVDQELSSPGTKVRAAASNAVVEKAAMSKNTEPTGSTPPKGVDVTERKSIGSIAEDSVLMLFSGKREAGDAALLADHRAKLERKQQEKNAQKLENERQEKERVRAKLLPEEKRQQVELERQQLYEEMKVDKNKELELVLLKGVSESLEQLQEAITLNGKVGEMRDKQASLLKKALQAENEKEAQIYWPKIGDLRELAVQQLADANNVSEGIRKQLDEVFEAIKVAKEDEMTHDNPCLDSYEKQARMVAQQLEKSVKERQSHQPSDEVMKYFYDAMKGQRQTLEQELEHLPNFTPGKSGDKFSKSELGELVLFAHRRIYQLHRELREHEATQDQRVEETLLAQQKVLDAEYKERVSRELAQQKSQSDEELQAQLKSLAEQHEKRTREELARQGLAKNTHATDMLNLQADQLYKNFQETSKQRISSEQASLRRSVAEAMDKLASLQSYAQGKADVVEAVEKVQRLVSSTRKLQFIISQPGTTKDTEYEMVDINDAVTQCRTSSPQDEFVQTILSAIPSQALDNGIYTLASLKDRFSSMYIDCQRNASFSSGKPFSFNVTPRYGNVSDFNEHGVEGMDAKSLLVQAQHFVERQHLAEAVKCMVQLGGMPGQLAKDWIREARYYLEVHQAADALTNYALSQALHQIL